ncbi:hypothetical protein [Enterobacter hormaechei]|uniref:hypothetical protein n=1 Tax=Enterobacter hormaechei TaxID=158836 RepID=UPI0005F97C45|nr:hypothetical protein [Enterobacter hormaechei]KJW92553.1 hypothetical protein SG65_15260 [Enterobacter hormaechei subsp. steigerwaltii]
MRELKVGGLALIIKSRIPENVGATVRLVEHLGVIKGAISGEEFEAWNVESASGSNLKGYMPGGLLIDWPTVNCPAKWLLPIDGGDFSNERESGREKSHA